MKKFIPTSILICLFAMVGFTQTKSKVTVNPIKASPAYAEILLKKVQVEGDLEELLLDYTDEFPKVKEAKSKLVLINKELDKLLALNTTEAGRLSEAVGKLIVGKIDQESEVDSLLKTYNEKHPDVIRAKKRLEIFEKAIKELFQ